MKTVNSQQISVVVGIIVLFIMLVSAAIRINELELDLEAAQRLYETCAVVGQE